MIKIYDRMRPGNRRRFWKRTAGLGALLLILLVVTAIGLLEFEIEKSTPDPSTHLTLPHQSEPTRGATSQMDQEEQAPTIVQATTTVNTPQARIQTTPTPQAPIAETLPTPAPTQPTQSPSSSSSSFLASIDTMKESRDTEAAGPLSQQDIQTIVNISASVNNNYITVDTNWDYPQYMLEWTNAIHAIGKQVWFRSAPNQWENDNGATGMMTPTSYEATEKSFILNNPGLFRSGDIFDACPEPEQGHYWYTTYGNQWTSNAPNTATRDFNAFIRNTTIVANQALGQLGITGVITTIRSTNSFFPGHPDDFEAQTVALLGRITIDSYPEQATTNGYEAASLRTNELQTIENLWHVPIVIGEIGYSNDVEVSDSTQQQVLQTELTAISSLSYIIGMNYWVGPGSPNDGGYTYIFIHSSNGEWVARPAAANLAAYYQTKENS